MMTNPLPLWTLEQGLALARKLEIIAGTLNAHIALGGGVLHRGHSMKDVDIFVYPHKKSRDFSHEKLLKRFGAQKVSKVANYDDEKYVYYCEIDGKRVDVFFVR